MKDWPTYDLDITYDFGGSFYGLRVGPAHLVVLAEYADAGPDSVQIRWLRSELARVPLSHDAPEISEIDPGIEFLKTILCV